MSGRERGGASRPLYMISVAAELAGMHPQTLRVYERRALVKPQRSGGNTRLYSDEDIERLRMIQHLTQDEGVNLAGVERIIALLREVEALRAEVEGLRRTVAESERRSTAEAERVRRSYRAEMVLVRRGGIVRRQG